MEKIFAEQGIETEIFNIGNKDIRGCIACGRCGELGKCVFDKTMKVGAGFVCARRGGTTASFDVVNKFFTISGMPIASSQYWTNFI